MPLQLHLSLLLSVLAVILSAAKDPDSLNIAATVRPFSASRISPKFPPPSHNPQNSPKNPCQAPFRTIPLLINQIQLAY
jgi:hypothetical protein